MQPLLLEWLPCSLWPALVDVDKAGISSRDQPLPQPPAKAAHGSCGASCRSLGCAASVFGLSRLHNMPAMPMLACPAASEPGAPVQLPAGFSEIASTTDRTLTRICTS